MKSKIFLTSLLFTTLVLSLHNRVYATHGMGMDLTYQCVGGNTYIFQLAFYRDCGGAAAPASANITFNSASCGQNFNRTLAFFSSQETTPICASLTTECNGGVFPGAQEYLYRATITLPAQCADWRVSYDLCCRNNDINTINTPGSQSIYTETFLNNLAGIGCNSSPSFSNDPVPFVCANQLYCFNNGASDADGDSLAYSLVTPKTGPNLADTVVFTAGYSAINPLSSTPAVTLDPLTGDFCMNPTDTNEISVLAILVEEYRNGVKIGSIRRDIQLRILSCPNGNSSPIATGIDSTNTFNYKICAGDPINFQIHSVDPDTGQTVTMNWNNAIAGANFTLSPGPRPVGTFNWTPTMADIRSNPYCFTVSVADDNCPFNAAQVFSYCIFVTGITSLVDSISEPSCFGDCDGVGAVQIVNGTPPFTYQWNDPALQTSDIANGLCAGVYNIIGTDSVGCVTNTNLAITEPNLLTVTGIVTSNYNGADISCDNDNDGTASGTPNGGTAPYSFVWDANAGNQTTDTAVGLSEGTYTFTVTDTNGCDTTGTVTLTDPAPITGSTQVASNYNGRMISCVGANDGMLSVNPIGGTGGYNFLWDVNAFNQVNDTAFGLSQGTYFVTVTDANGCDTTFIDSLKDPPPLVPVAVAASDYNGSPISCNNLTDGNVRVTATGGTAPFTYLWDPAAGSQTTDTAFMLGDGTYSVTVTDTNGCQEIASVTIVEPAPLVATIAIKKDVYCNGQNTGEAIAAASGGISPYRYSWNTAPPTLNAAVTNLAFGTYVVTVTDTNGCVDDTSVSIAQSLAMNANTNSLDPSCTNGLDGKAYATPTGGNPPYVYIWSTNSGTQVGDTARNLSIGWHYLVVRDSLNCIINDSVFLNNPDPVLVNVSADDTICSGVPTMITALGSGGTGNQYSYSWDNGLPAQASNSVSPAVTTVYTVTAADSLGCPSDPAQVTLSIRNFDNDQLNVTVSNNVCLGDSATVLANHIASFDNYTYVWNPAIGLNTGPITVIPDTATTYVLSIFDQCGNTISDSASIEVYPYPEVFLADTIAAGCLPLEVIYRDSINAGLGYTYQWSFGDGSTSIDPSPTHVYNEAGEFGISLAVTSDKGCTTNNQAGGNVYVFQTPIIVFEADPLSTSIVNPIVNFNNSSSFASDYIWNFGDGDTSTAENPSHTYQDTGTYRIWLVGTSGNGCIDSSQLLVSIEPFFEIEIPNAFSPNPFQSSGGKYDPDAMNNDVFFPHTTGVQKYHLMIWNRWGEMIFESFEHEIGWDGYYKGKLAQQEVYVWKLDITWMNGQKLNKVGDLTLFR